MVTNKLNKMTAVEWLVEKMLSQGWYTYKSLKYIQQAKEMEKEQQGYTEEEVLDILKQYSLEEHLITSSKPDVWFKQFKK